MSFDHTAYFLGKRTELMKSIKLYSINWNVTEPYSNGQNQEEDGIKLIKLIRNSTIPRTG